MTDSHVHLQNYPPGMLPRAIQRARAAGVDRFVCCGTRPRDWARVAEIAAEYPGVVRPCYGVHPWHVGQAGDPSRWLGELARRLDSDPSAGVGEIGLDGARRGIVSDERQMDAMMAQLELAGEKGRDVSLHCVHRDAELVAALKAWRESCEGKGLARVDVMLHGASCTAEFWREYEKLGLGASIGCAVLADGHRNVKVLAAMVPTERLFFETDSPDGAFGDLAIMEFMGRNSPENTVRVKARALALRAGGDV